MGIYHDSTIFALEYYSENGYPEFKGTLMWVKLIRKWWNINNVNELTHGQRKRDPTREPIRSEDSESIKFLKKFGDYLKGWMEQEEKKNKKGGEGGGFKNSLSRETFQSMIQTSYAVAEASVYLLKEKGFNFVLTSKFLSDRIEGRFGKWRQMSGANYYISILQVLQAEKALKASSIAKYTNVSFKELGKLLEEATKLQLSKEEKLLALFEEMLEDIFINVKVENKDIANTLFFLAGFLAHAIAKKIKCEKCKEMLMDY